jgi:endonuclease-3
VHDSPFQLIVATVLSAQSTDVAVNRVTPELFRRWPSPQALAAAKLEDVQEVLQSLGMFRQKSKNIVGLSARLVGQFDGEVPRSLDELVSLPGVGRKTANVVLGVAFGAPEGVVVDTHVQRISQRLGWTKSTTPEAIERDLMKLFDRRVWDPLSHTLIFHGRRICAARKPACAVCSVNDVCVSAFHAEHVGRKPPKARGSRTTSTTDKKKAKKAKKAKKNPSPEAAAKSRTTATKVADTKTKAKQISVSKATTRAPARSRSAARSKKLTAR